MPGPAVDVSDFEDFTGITLTDPEAERVDILLDRARRALQGETTLPDSLAGDDLADWNDAVSELAWLWWEAEKADVMEILALPVSQLSLGTLFWTKGTPTGPGALPNVKNILARYGNILRRRVILEGELGYPVP